MSETFSLLCWKTWSRSDSPVSLSHGSSAIFFGATGKSGAAISKISFARTSEFMATVCLQSSGFQPNDSKYLVATGQKLSWHLQFQICIKADVAKWQTQRT